jgi:hypothetical protein
MVRDYLVPQVTDSYNAGMFLAGVHRGLHGLCVDAGAAYPAAGGWTAAVWQTAKVRRLELVLQAWQWRLLRPKSVCSSELNPRL